MNPAKAIAIGLLAWPAAEIVTFFCVAAAFGFVNALLLVMLMSLAGVLVLRHFSREVGRMQAAGGGWISASIWSSTLGPTWGGILLIIPGFLTSALGVIVLFPISRRWLLSGFRRMFASAGRPPADPGVIDLSPDEWKPLPGTKLPPASDAPEK
jgi:UPF0716 family protein affecting phage T7 exclusion